MSTFLNQFAIGSIPLGDSGRPPVLIAETACAHEGDPELAKQLTDVAAAAGADIVQLQIFRRGEQVPPSHKLNPLLEKLELSDSEWAEVFRHAEGCGAEVMAFVYDVPSLKLALEFDIVALKLNSADLLNRPLLEECAKSGLPIFLGTGASTMDEISRSLGHLRKCGATKVILMHGVQDFPTALHDSRMDRVRLLREVFGMPVGYGDHTDATLPIAKVADLVAVGLGVSALEKHITLDREKGQTDFQAALEPNEWREYAETIREAASALSAVPPVDLTSADHRYRKFQKKYAVASRSLHAGEVLQQGDVRFLRLEETGDLSALDMADLGTVRLTRSLPAFDVIRRTDLAPAEENA